MLNFGPQDYGPNRPQIICLNKAKFTYCNGVTSQSLVLEKIFLRLTSFPPFRSLILPPQARINFNGTNLNNLFPKTIPAKLGSIWYSCFSR